MDLINKSFVNEDPNLPKEFGNISSIAYKGMWDVHSIFQTGVGENEIFTVEKWKNKSSPDNIFIIMNVVKKLLLVLANLLTLYVIKIQNIHISYRPVYLLPQFSRA